MAKDEPGFLQGLLAWGGNILGGIRAGLGLNWWLAPGSDWAAAVGLFALPLIFGVGMQMWTAAMAGVAMKRLTGTLWGMFRRGTDFRTEAQAQFADLRGRPIPGTGAFLWVGLLIGPLAGLLTAFTATAGFLTVLAVWSAAGIGYGMFLRWLAGTGRLPPPDA